MRDYVETKPRLEDHQNKIKKNKYKKNKSATTAQKIFWDTNKWVKKKKGQHGQITRRTTLLYPCHKADAYIVPNSRDRNFGFWTEGRVVDISPEAVHRTHLDIPAWQWNQSKTEKWSKETIINFARICKLTCTTVSNWGSFQLALLCTGMYLCSSSQQVAFIQFSFQKPKWHAAVTSTCLSPSYFPSQGVLKQNNNGAFSCVPCTHGKKNTQCILGFLEGEGKKYKKNYKYQIYFTTVSYFSTI